MKKKSKIRHLKGSLKADDARIGIIVARFNEFFTSQLLEGAVDTLLRFGVKPGHGALRYVTVCR